MFNLKGKKIVCCYKKLPNGKSKLKWKIFTHTPVFFLYFTLLQNEKKYFILFDIS